MITEQEFQTIKERLQRELIPIGCIVMYSSKNVPNGYLPCEGQELLISKYQELYAVIGKTFGGTDKTFLLPDLQGRFVRGWDRGGNVDTDRKFGEEQEDAFQGHAHELKINELEMENNGSHDHDLYWAEFSIRDPSINDLNNHTCKYAVPYSLRETDSYGRKNRSYERLDGSTVEGSHSHKILLKEDCQGIGTPVDSIFCSVKNKVQCETRPKNIALIFCIKIK